MRIDSGADQGEPRRPRRLRFVTIGVLGITALSVAGWIGASRIKSPAEVAARSAAPTASLIGVPTVRTLLTSDVVVRGTTHYSTPQKLTLPSSSLKAGPGIVTTLPEKGAQVREGDVLMSVSGRPVYTDASDG